MEKERVMDDAEIRVNGIEALNRVQFLSSPF